MGAATRSPPPSSAVSFFFATRLGSWHRLGLCRTRRRTTTTKPGSPQTPIPRTENRQNFIANFFFDDFKNTRQHLFNSSKGWPLNNPFGPSPSGQGAHHFSRLLDLAVGGVGLGRGLWGSGPLGAATRCPRRRRPFHFFSRLGLFWRFGTFGFWASRRTTDDDDETGLPPLNPLVLRTENRQIFIAKFFFQKKIWRQIFFGDFKKQNRHQHWVHGLALQEQAVYGIVA